MQQDGWLHTVTSEWPVVDLVRRAEMMIGEATTVLGKAAITPALKHSSM
jgi:hypothetical protein